MIPDSPPKRAWVLSMLGPILALPVLISISPAHAASAGHAVFTWHTGADVAVRPVAGGHIQTHETDTFSLVADGFDVRPGDRYHESLLLTDAGRTDAHSRWNVHLHDLKSGKLLARDSHLVTAERMRLDTDVRRVASTSFRLRVELEQNGEIADALEHILHARTAEDVPAPGERIRVGIDWPDTHTPHADSVVTFGVPFAPGVLWNTKSIRIVNADGVEVPSQRTPSARWSREGAVRWLRVDAQAAAGEDLFVEFAPAQTALPEDPVHISAVGEHSLMVRTGGMEYLLANSHSPVSEIRSDGHWIASAAATRGLYVVDNLGRLATAAPGLMEVEAKGPVEASVRFEGYYRTADGAAVARHITRLEFHAGQPGANVTHTLILTADSNELWLTEVGWEFAVGTGKDPRALFGMSAADPVEHRVVALTEDTPAAALIQKDYIQYGGGDKHFALLGLDAAGHELTVLENGAEMGDWAALAGDTGGLLLSCREAARQHPKEFAIHADRILLKLFTPRAGHALDMRPAALVERWNRGGRIRGGNKAALEAIETTAAGWAKTHSILLLPFGADTSIPLLADASHLHSSRVYALVDPHWTYRSGVLGPLYPEDRARFPEAETMMAAAMADYLERAHSRDAEYGFVDYFAGPHYRRALGDVRFRIAYATRMAGWLQYARSGRRDLREYAEGTNRVYGDSYMIHAGTGDRVTGLFAGADELMGRYPFYWGSRSSPFGGGGPNSINQFLWDYYLTGYRRAEDIALAYGEGMKAWWQPGISTWYRLKVLRNLWLLYAHNHDPELSVLIEDFMDAVYDPDGAIAIHQDAIPNSTTYKLEEDTLGVVEAWELLGDSRYLDMARRMAGYTWEQSVGTSPLNSRFDKGRVGHFLYQQTGDPAIAAEMFRALREGSAGDPVGGISQQNFRLIGIPYALALTAETGADEVSPAAWAGFDAFGYPAALVADKDEVGSLELTATGGDISLHTVGDMRPSLLHAIYSRQGVNHISIPRDSHAGGYRIDPRTTAPLFAVADRRTPLVVYAPEYWRPTPASQSPAIPVYFMVPEQIDGQPRIFFEGPTYLFRPDGSAYADGTPQRGWIDLPRDQPGLWHFTADTFYMVRVRNLPPFFAYDDPTFYFIPEIEWSDNEPDPAPRTGAQRSGFVAMDEERQALYLATTDTLELAAGITETDGRGGPVLPARAGTIEFHLKPDWSTFDLFPSTDVNIIELATTGTSPWHLKYSVHTHPRGWPVEWRSHIFDGEIMSPEGRAVTLRRAIVEPDTWIHVAMVWEPTVRVTRRGSQEDFHVTVYIDGDAGNYWRIPNMRTAPEDVPVSLLLGKSLSGTIANLRISDIARYDGLFTPTEATAGFAMDEHTLALFDLDGRLEGNSHARSHPLSIQLNRTSHTNDD